MVRRLASSMLFLMMMNVIALGGGLFSIDRGTDCAAAMAKMGKQHHDAPAKQGCNLPWAQGCESTAPCTPVALVVSQAATAPIQSRDLTMVAVLLAPTAADVAPDHPPPKA